MSAEPLRLSLSERRKDRPDFVLEVDGTDYPVRTVLGTTEMARILEITEEVQATQGNGELGGLFREAYEIVMGMIRERTPGAPDLVIAPDEVLDILDVIATVSAGGQKIAPHVAEALAGGDAAGITAGEGESGGGGSEGGSAPLATRSRKRSSRSAASTDGRPGSGGASRGRTAASTSSRAPVA